MKNKRSSWELLTLIAIGAGAVYLLYYLNNKKGGGTAESYSAQWGGFETSYDMKKAIEEFGYLPTPQEYYSSPYAGPFFNQITAGTSLRVNLDPTNRRIPVRSGPIATAYTPVSPTASYQQYYQQQYPQYYQQQYPTTYTSPLNSCIQACQQMYGSYYNNNNNYNNYYYD